MTPDHAGQLAVFLLEETGSIWGTWRGRMSAAEQRALFGRYLGKGLLVIDGHSETIRMWVKVCFGLDSDLRQHVHWRDLR